MTDFMDSLDKIEKKRRKRPTPKEIGTGLGDAVSLRDKVDKAADTGKSKKHGNYVQYTMRLDEADVQQIKQWADELGLPHTHMYRWIVARGLLALDEGEQPEIEYKRVPQVKLP